MCTYNILRFAKFIQCFRLVQEYIEQDEIIMNAMRKSVEKCARSVYLCTLFLDVKEISRACF